MHYAFSRRSGVDRDPEKELGRGISSVSPERVRAALEAGAKPKRAFGTDEGHLYWALKQRNVERVANLCAVVKALIDGGAAIEDYNDDMESPLYVASTSDYADQLVPLLLEKGGGP